eukprot:gene22096-biopygen30785
MLTDEMVGNDTDDEYYDSLSIEEDVQAEKFMEVAPEFFSRIKCVQKLNKKECVGDMYYCEPATNIWSNYTNPQISNEIEIEFNSKFPNETKNKTKSKKIWWFVDTVRGRDVFLQSVALLVLDEKFADYLDINPSLFAIKNGVFDTSLRDTDTVVFRKIEMDDNISMCAKCEYQEEDNQQLQQCKKELDDFFLQILPVEEKHDVVLGFFAGLLSGRRNEKKFLALTDKTEKEFERSDDIADVMPDMEEEERLKDAKGVKGPEELEGLSSHDKSRQMLRNKIKGTTRMGQRRSYQRHFMCKTVNKGQRFTAGRTSAPRRLDISSPRVKNLTPLSGLTGLTYLDIDDTNAVGLTPLSGLTGLINLHIAYSQVQYLSPLSGLIGLGNLDISFTQVQDLSPLSGLTGLTDLCMSSTQVKDLSHLSGLTGLVNLHIESTQVKDLAPLSSLIGLVNLVISSTQVEDVAPLSGHTGLTVLHMRYTRVKVLTPLSGLTGLTVLHIRGTRVKDLSPISGLTRLIHMDISDTEVEDLTPMSGLSNLTDLHMRSDCSDGLALRIAATFCHTVHSGVERLHHGDYRNAATDHVRSQVPLPAAHIASTTQYTVEVINVQLNPAAKA